MGVLLLWQRATDRVDPGNGAGTPSIIDPGSNNNYVGLRNRIAILSEAYSYASFEERILATLAFVKENLHYAHQNAATIRQTLDTVDLATVVGQTFAVRSAYSRSAEPVDILLGEVEETRNPYTGEVMYLRKETVSPTSMYEYGQFSAKRLNVHPEPTSCIRR